MKGLFPRRPTKRQQLDPGLPGLELDPRQDQADDVFAVPAASGCTDDNTVNALLGLPSPSGANHLVLEDASSSLALPNAGQNGIQWSTDWHTAFGGSPPSTTTTTTSSTTTTT